MYYDLEQFEDPQLISFFVDNLKREDPVHFEEYGDRRMTKDYFYHTHDKVKIMKPPKYGPEKNISRNGIPKMHIFGNAVSIPKDVHAVYCSHIHPKRYHKNDLITHPLEERVLFYQGQEIIARWDVFGVYYSGIIVDIINTKCADVKFLSGHKIIDVPFSNIIAVKRRKLKVGDFVMAKILNEYDKECWIPGIVTLINYDEDPIAYHIFYYNGQKGINIFIDLIKISRVQYDTIKEYILSMLREKQEITDITYDFVDLVENVELFIFGKEYRELRAKYQPLLQPSDSYLPVITTQSNEFLNMRKSLPTLKIGDEVLAKWPDDCLYYPSVIKENMGDYRYKVENNLRAVKIIYREDLINKSLHQAKELSIGDTVLAEHPKFKFVYAPGEIRRLDKYQNKIIIRFYDFSESLIEQRKIYTINKNKFESDINSVIKLENAWIGHKVLTYNFYNKSYEWGKIIRRVLNHRQFLIEWPDRRQSIHCAYLLFVNKSKTYDNFIRNDDSKFNRALEHEVPNFQFIKASEYSQQDDSSKVRKIKLKEPVEYLRRAKSCSLIDKDRETPILDAEEFYEQYYD